jgi:hypothetical protein
MAKNYPDGNYGKQVGGKLEGNSGAQQGMGVTQQGNGKPKPALPVKNLTPPRGN